MICTLAEARLRVTGLPADDDAAQAAIDEQTGWLANRIGPLDGVRVETFYVGYGRSCGPLNLRRYTDGVTVIDGGTTLDADQFRLGPDATIERVTALGAELAWAGPYVTAEYRPTDEDAVRKAVYDLLAIAADSAGPYESEQIGAYSYRRGTRGFQTRAATVSSILPRRPGALTTSTAR